MAATGAQQQAWDVRCTSGPPAPSGGLGQLADRCLEASAEQQGLGWPGRSNSLDRRSNDHSLCCLWPQLPVEGAGKTARQGETRINFSSRRCAVPPAAPATVGAAIILHDIHMLVLQLCRPAEGKQQAQNREMAPLGRPRPSAAPSRAA